MRRMKTRYANKRNDDGEEARLPVPGDALLLPAECDRAFNGKPNPMLGLLERLTDIIPCRSLESTPPNYNCRKFVFVLILKPALATAFS